MPLKARLDGRLLVSVALPAGVAWDDVRDAAREGRVVMDCCGAGAVAKRLASGTRFFAHKPMASPCAWEDESADHLRLKAAACEAASAAGATADVEVRGDGWIADVLADHGGARRAVEIQLARQTAEETRRRTLRYRASGVEVLWLFRRQPEGLAANADLPTFALAEDMAEAEKEVRRLVAAFAVGRLAWDDGEREAPVTLVGHDVQCQGCGEVFHQVPMAIVRRCERDGEAGASIARAAGLEWRSGDPWGWDVSFRSGKAADPLGRRFGASPDGCPTCRRDAPPSPLRPEDARAWPHGRADGVVGWRIRPGWRPEPAAPRPFACGGTREGWTDVLRARGALLDPEEAARRAPGLRRDHDARVRRAEDAERERRRGIEERHRAERRRTSEMVAEIRGRPGARSRVRAEVERTDLGTVSRVRLGFPYDPDALDRLRDLRGAWDPAGKTWTVEVGFSGERILAGIRDLVLSLRARHDRR